MRNEKKNTKICFWLNKVELTEAGLFRPEQTELKPEICVGVFHSSMHNGLKQNILTQIE